MSSIQLVSLSVPTQHPLPAAAAALTPASPAYMCAFTVKHLHKADPELFERNFYHRWNVAESASLAEICSLRVLVVT